jgi:hypothetical protein
MLLYICVCVCVCLCARAHTHTHTHTHSSPEVKVDWLVMVIDFQCPARTFSESNIRGFPIVALIVWNESLWITFVCYQIIEKCSEIKWHFIGHLQRNKVSKVVSVPGLYLVETVDTVKLATALDSAWTKQKGQGTKLRVMAQINTSGEDG